MLTFKGQYTDRRAAWPRRVPWVTVAEFINLSWLSQSLSDVLPRDIRFLNNFQTGRAKLGSHASPQKGGFGGS